MLVYPLCLNGPSVETWDIENDSDGLHNPSGGENDNVIMDISANTFLHHMVRNIAGVLMDISLGKQLVDWTQDLLELKSRKLAGVTAPPDGLYLGAVYYPEQYDIAKHTVFNKLPSDARWFD